MEEVMAEAWATIDLFPPPPRLSTAGESPPRGTCEGRVDGLPAGPLVSSTVSEVKVQIRSKMIFFCCWFFMVFYEKCSAQHLILTAMIQFDLTNTDCAGS